MIQTCWYITGLYIMSLMVLRKGRQPFFFYVIFRTRTFRLFRRPLLSLYLPKNEQILQNKGLSCWLGSENRNQRGVKKADLKRFTLVFCLDETSDQNFSEHFIWRQGKSAHHSISRISTTIYWDYAYPYDLLKTLWYWMLLPFDRCTRRFRVLH